MFTTITLLGNSLMHKSITVGDKVVNNMKHLCWYNRSQFRHLYTFIGNVKY
jgi:hypothetical protein